MGEWTRAELAARDELRLVPAEALHVTLAFLGAIEAARVGEVWEAVRVGAGGHGAPCLAATGVAGRPRRRPRLFALELADEGERAAALQASIAAALGAVGLYELEERRFWPHVTLARVRRGERAPRLGSDAPDLAPFRASRLVLYRSRPGSDYEALERLELAGRTDP